MTDSSTRAGGRRRAGWVAGIALLLVAALVVGLRFAPSLLGWGAANAVVSAAEEEVRDLPGVTSATAELDQRIRTPSAARRDLVDPDNSRPRGEVTVAVMVEEELAAAELARVLGSVRSAFDDDALDRHIVSISYVQRGTDVRIFDGRGTVWKPKKLTAGRLEAIAAHALTLPEGAWFDLDPTTFEQGRSGRIGPAIYADLLGMDAANGYTIGASIEAETTTAFLDEVARMTARAAADLDGPTAPHLTGPGDESVLTATAPPALADALSDITASVRDLDEPDAVILSFEAGVEWELSLDGAEGIPTVSLTLAPAGPSVPCSVFAPLLEDAEHAFEDRSIRHTVTSSGCATGGDQD